MLHSIKKLKRYEILATDGRVGGIRDVYFDDDKWVVRYLVVDTGRWLAGRKVLISPYAVKTVDRATEAITVNLTREQVERSPDIDTDKPVSRQQEEEYHRYYGYPEYWPYTTLWAWGAMPVVVPPDEESRAEADEMREAADEADRSHADPHLRSSDEVIGYHIQAADATVGHVEDFLFDDETWAIRYLAVDTRNWWPGKHVLVSPRWIRDVSWADRTLTVEMSRQELEQSPEYDPQRLPMREPEGAPRPRESRPGHPG